MYLFNVHIRQRVKPFNFNYSSTKLVLRTEAHNHVYCQCVSEVIVSAKLNCDERISLRPAYSWAFEQYELFVENVVLEYVVPTARLV